MSADYYVIFHETGGNIYGVSTFQPVLENIPQDYVVEGRTGDLPRDLTEWDNNARQFGGRKPGVTPNVLSKLEFLESLTLEERVTMRTSQDPVVKDISDMFNAASFVDLQHVATVQALGYLTLVGILTQDRVNQIRGL